MEEVRASVRALPDSGGGRQQWRQLPKQGQDAHHSPEISPVQLTLGRPAEESKDEGEGDKRTALETEARGQEQAVWCSQEKYSAHTPK